MTQYWDKLHKQVAELNLEKVVHFSGYLPADTASLYIAGADIGVLPFHCGVTIKSGSLLTLLAHGLPVIATHHNPPEPVLADEQIVRLVAPRDPDGLVIALIELLPDPAKCLQLGHAGYHFARNFNWEAITKAHLGIYQTVVEQENSD